MQLLALGILCSLLAAPGSLRSQQKVDFHRAATPNASVRLMGFFGGIKVTGWDADSIAIVGTLGAGSTFHGPPESDLVMGMKAYVEAPNDASAKASRLELFVPRNARVWIKAGSADIEVSRVSGSLDLNIAGGSVKVNAKPRELIVESMDGDVTFTGFAEYARLKTATGNINLPSNGDDYTVSTVSGTITVSPVPGGVLQRSRFESVTGAINFEGDIAHGGDARFDTHSGNIELRLPRSPGIEVDASTMTGSIENQYTKARPIVGREGRGMELGLGGGAGGGHITIRTFKGNIKVAAK